MGTTRIAFPVAGGISEISLLEIQTFSGVQYFLSDQEIANMPSVLSGPLSPTLYRGWIDGPCKFKMNGSTQTDTGTIRIQNVSGNTIQRDAAGALAANEFIGAFIYYRLWNAAAETALFSFMGNISDAEFDDESLDLSIEGFGNWSAVRAPSYDIGVSCGLSFGSMQCGSTSNACSQSYGTCTSKERFMGVVIQYDSSNLSPSLIQIAQPAPAVAYNPARPF